MNLPARSNMLCYAALPPQQTFNSTVRAISEHGFTELSLWMDAIDQGVKENGSASAMRNFLSDCGLKASVLEFLHEWTNPDSEAYLEEAERYLELAEALDAQVLMCGCLESTISNAARAVQQLREQCDVLAQADRKLAFEFLPWSAIDTLPKALELIHQVNKPNLGLVIDTWHLLQAGHTTETLRLITDEPVFVVQLSDTGKLCGKSSLLEETMNSRLLPGEGIGDWQSLSTWFSAHCEHAIYGAEVFNSDIKERALDNALTLLASATPRAFRSQSSSLK